MSGGEQHGTRVDLTREDGFRFRVRFDAEGVPELITDEPPPLGEGAGPNPAALLAAAVGQCLASSLLFCMRRAHLDVEGFAAEVHTTTTRNATGRLRIGEIRVRLAPTVSTYVKERMGRCLEVFESFCLVTESVRAGVQVRVAVEPQVFAPGAEPTKVDERARCALSGDT
jgi:organic hydroperoxide reductase OsmC/OhrA